MNKLRKRIANERFIAHEFWYTILVSKSLPVFHSQIWTISSQLPYEWHSPRNAFLFLQWHRLNFPVFSVSVLLFHASVLPVFPAPDTCPD